MAALATLLYSFAVICARGELGPHLQFLRSKMLHLLSTEGAIFSARDVTTCLWAFSILDEEVGGLLRTALPFITGVDLSLVDAGMLRQVFAFAQAPLPFPLPETRREGRTSSSQQAVANCLHRLRFSSISLELPIGAIGELLIDIVFYYKGARILCEFDGPSHFLQALSPDSPPQYNGK